MEQYINRISIQKYIHKLQDSGIPPDEVKNKLRIIQKYIYWLGKTKKLPPLILEEVVEEIKKHLEKHQATVQATLKQIEEPKSSQLNKILFGFNSQLKALNFHSPDRTPLQSFIGLTLMIIFLGALGGGIYTRFFVNPTTPLAFPSSLTRAGRILSYQGRLTDSLGNPITTATNLRFRLYDVSSGGSDLYDTGTCSITPDQDGIFNTLVGDSCGAEIDSSVFTENAEIFIGTTVGSDSEMTPRQQIANVGYAMNAETLQGLPPGTQTSNIPYINQDGDLLIAATNGSNTSGIRATASSVNFTVSSANTTTIQSAGSGDVVLNASGSGTLLFQTNGFNRATLNGSGDLLIGGGSFNNASGSEDLYVTGNLEVDGTIYGTLSGNVNPGFTTGSVVFQGPSGLAQDNTNFFWDNTTDRLGIRTNSPLEALSVTGNASLSGNLTLGNGSVIKPAYGPLKLQYKSGLNSYADALTIQDTTGKVGIGTTDPTSYVDIVSTNTTNGQTRIGYDSSNYTSFTVSSGGDLTLDASGGQILFNNGDTLNVGGISAAAYNAFASSGEAPEEAGIADDNDLYIGGNLEVDGIIYGDGSGITGIASAIADDSLDFNKFEDTLDLDASTEINFGANNFTFDLDSTGDFVIADNGTPYFTFSDTGTLTQAGSGQVTLTGNVDATSGLDVTGANLTVGGANFSVTTAGAITGTSLNVGTGAITSGAITTSGTLTLSGVSTDITTGTDQDLVLIANGTGVTKVGDLTTNGVVYTSGGDGTLNAEAQLAIARGGTNSTATPTAGGVAYGTGSAYAFTGQGISGQCLVSNVGSAPSWTNCVTGATTVAWSSLTNPAADLSLSHADYATTFTWDTPATSNARDALSLAYIVDAGTDATTQRLLVLNNNDDSGSTGTLERLLVLDNKDANEAVTTGLEILGSSTGTITTAIDISDAELGTGLALGANDITGSTAVINFTNFDVASNGGITVASGQGLDTNAGSGTLNLGSTNATTVNIGDSATTNFGGGYASTGVSISSAGNLQAAGTLTVDSTSTLTGAVTMTNGFDSNAASTVAGLTVDGNGNLSVSNGTLSVTSPTTTGNANSFTATSLTTGSLSNFTSSNNSAANTAWSANKFNITNAQGTTAVSSGSIAGIDVQFTQNTSVNTNTETVARFNIAQNNSSSTDSTVTSIIDIANNDTATGNQITATNGLIITGSNITNGINLSGTFGTNLITSTNFSVTQAGGITAGGDLDINGTSNDIAGTLNLSGNTLASSGDLTIDPTGGGVKIGTGTPGTVDLAGDDLYVTADLEVDGVIYGNGSGITNIGASSISDDSLDFAQFQDTLDLGAALSLNQTTNTWTQTFTGTTGPGFSYTASGAVTSGNAAAFDINASNASTSVPAVMISNAGSSHALRVNDDGTTTDSSPFVITASGDVAIGATSASQKLDVNGSIRADSFIDSSNASYLLDPAATGNSLVAAGSILLDGDAAINGGDITTTSGTFNVANAATTLNLGSTNVTRTINIGTGTNADTINIGTGGTTADAITIGASVGNLTLVDDNWNVTAAGAANFASIGATTRGSGQFTTLDANGAVTIGDASGDTVTVNSASWTFANDTNFALSGGVNGLAFDTDVLSIDGSNNIVGIGTTTPSTSYKLDVVGDIRTNTLLRADNIAIGGNDDGAFTGCSDFTDLICGSGNLWLAANGGSIFLEDAIDSATVTNTLTLNGNLTVGNASGDTVTVNSASWTFANDTNFALSGGVNGLSFDTDTLSIDGSNNRVGIGTTTPGVMLDVFLSGTNDPIARFGSSGSTDGQSIQVYNGNANFAFAVAGTSSHFTPGSAQGDGVLRYGTGKKLVFGDSGATDMTIDGSGNIGIGTTAPLTKLNLNDGDFILTGTSANFAADQGSIVNNAGFEINADGTSTVGDTWTSYTTAGSPTFAVATTTSALHGERSQQLIAPGGSTATGGVYSLCFPITGGANYFLRGQGKQAASTSSVVNFKLETYTTRATCNSRTSPTTYAGGAIFTNTTSSALSSSVTPASTQYWSRFVIEISTGTAATYTVDSIMVSRDTNAVGLDIAEDFPFDPSRKPVAGEIVKFGLTDETTQQVQVTTESNERNILGVISTKPGITLIDGTNQELRVPVALKGRVPVKVSAENGPILIGDYLTSSSTPGVAMKQTKAGMTIGRALTNFNGTSTDGSQTVIVFVETAYINPEIYLSSTGDVQIQTDSAAAQTFIYNGNLSQTQNQMENALYSVINSAGKNVEKVGAYSKITSAQIYSGLIETKNVIVNNTLLAKNIIVTNIEGTTARFNKLNVTEKIQSPIIETNTLAVTETASIEKLNTTQIAAPNGNLTIELGQDNNTSQNSATPSGVLAQLIVKGLEGRTVGSIDAAGNASFSGTIAASQVQTDTLTADSISTDNLSVQTATVNTLEGNEASLSGKLIAKEVEADNIKDIVTNNQALSKQVNEVQQLLADIRNQPMNDPDYYQTVSDQQWDSVTTETLNVTGNANLYTVTVANNLAVGNLLLENNSIISLSSELALKALDKVSFFDGSVVIAKNGTITTEGTLIAKAGIETDIIRPLNDSENVTVANLATNKLSITDKYLSATSSATVIAATDNFNRNGLFIPAIETTKETAGIGVLPAEEYEILIYNEQIKKDSLIYLTPTQNIPDSPLTIVEKKVCEVEEVGCKSYFKVSSGSLNHPDLQFNWLIVN